MATKATLILIEGNDVDVACPITLNGAAWDLTGATVTCTVKASARTDDADAMFVYTSEANVDIAIDGSIAVVRFKRADLVKSGTYWHRLDVVDDAGRVLTARYGPLEVIDV